MVLDGGHSGGSCWLVTGWDWSVESVDGRPIVIGKVVDYKTMMAPPYFVHAGVARQEATYAILLEKAAGECDPEKIFSFDEFVTKYYRSRDSPTATRFVKSGRGSRARHEALRGIVYDLYCEKLLAESSKNLSLTCKILQENGFMSEKQTEAIAPIISRI